MGPILTVANILGGLRIALSLMSLTVFIGSGWELLVLVMITPGLISGVLLLVAGHRSNTMPGVATVLFIAAAVSGAVAIDADPIYGGGWGFFLSLLLTGAFIVGPAMLALVTFRRYLKTRGVEVGGAARES